MKYKVIWSYNKWNEIIIVLKTINYFYKSITVGYLE